MEQKIFDPDGVGVDNGTYFGLPFAPETAELVLISAPWDVTVSYGAGAAYAPDAVIEASTRHMAGSRLFGRMKPGAVLINSSRGEVVDGEALLRSGLGWALDVWEHEPNPDPALLENALLATPHIAGYSEQGKANATAMSVASLARRFGLPLDGWYPPQAAPAVPRPISWQELCRTIDGAYDIAAESRRLKERPGDFESMRDHYAYRREYF